MIRIEPNATWLNIGTSLLQGFFFKNGPSSASFSFIFGLFKQTIEIVQQIDVNNVYSVSGTGIQTRDILIMTLLL